MSSVGRPFQCPIWRRGFRSYSNLKSHMDEHTPPRRCRNCGKGGSGGFAFVEIVKEPGDSRQSTLQRVREAYST
jgi:hypothetical protein